MCVFMGCLFVLVLIIVNDKYVRCLLTASYVESDLFSNTVLNNVLCLRVSVLQVHNIAT